MIDYRQPGMPALLLIAAALAAWPPAPLQAQQADLNQSELDCVIEAKQMVELGSSEQGLVTELAVERGDVVEAGAVVARLDSVIQTLAVELARHRAERTVEIKANAARLEYRRREIARLQKLYEKDIVSTKSLDEAQVERRLAEYNLKAARVEQEMARMELRLAEARLDRRTIRSPVNGVIVEVTMAPGELAHDQSQLVTIAVIDPLNVEIFAPIALYGTIKRGMLAEVQLENPVGGLYKARVAVVDRVLDTASDTFGVRLELPNADHSIPAGLRCRVRFLLDAPIVVEP
jgi:RND family efflux transporter MFP subunit